MIKSNARFAAPFRATKKVQPVQIVKKKMKSNRRLPKSGNKPEEKYFDVNATVAVAADNTGIVLVNGIGSNTTNNSRIGNKINLKSIQYRVTIVSGNAPQDTPYRIMIVYDKECDGALPSVFGGLTTNSILDNTTVAASTSCPMNINNTHRYVILSDKLYNFQHKTTIGLTGALNPMYIGHKKWKKLNTFTQYNAVGSAIGQINNGAIYMVFISDVPSGANANPSALLGSRLRFTDQ